MAVNTWTAVSGTADWNTAGDWSLGSVPTTGDVSVAITNAGTYTITVANETESGNGSSTFTMNAAGATLELDAGGAITYGGTGLLTAGLISMTAATSIFEMNDLTLNGGVIKGQGLVGGRSGSTQTWSFSNGSSIEATAGTLTVAGASAATVLGNANLVIDAGADMLLGTGTSLSGTSTITFGGAGTLAIGNLTASNFTSNVFNAQVHGVLANAGGPNFAGASVFELLGVATAPTSTAIKNHNTLEVVDNGVTYDIVTDGNFSGMTLHTQLLSGNLYFWVCYAAGTRILAESGEIAVEDIAEADRVVTIQDGRQVLQPVKWVGHRRLDLSGHPRRDTAAPVRIARGALGENRPHRELVVSPDHGLIIDGKLVPAKLLINGMTITQDLEVQSVTYYHIELDRHSILLAEGVTAESYLDTGNRAFFSNCNTGLVLHPEFTVNAGLQCWTEDACAPLTVRVEEVEPIWHDIAARARTMGCAEPSLATTTEPALHLVADGQKISAIQTTDGSLGFVVPAGVEELRLVSRASTPTEVTPYNGDDRLLGVAVSRIIVRTTAAYQDVPVDHPGLADGWHAVEKSGGSQWRWTNGNAIIPLAAMQEPVVVEVQFTSLSAYVLRDATRQPARLAA
jgi:antigen 43